MIIIYLFSIVFSLASSIINAENLPKNQVKPSWNFKDGVKKSVVVEPLGAMVRIIFVCPFKNQSLFYVIQILTICCKDLL